MNRKTKTRILAINLLLFASLFGLVSLNKEFLRPALHQVPIAGVLTGCFPNFIAAYIIGLAFVNAVVIRQPQSGRPIVYTSSGLIFGVLAFEEIVPIWGASGHYDSFDIVASGAGSLLAVLTFELIAWTKALRRLHPRPGRNPS